MAPAEPDLVPAVIMPDDELDDDDDEDGQAGVGRMEIVTKSGGRVIVGADVDAGALARVLKVLARR